MPEVNAFLSKKAGKKRAKSGEWDLSALLTSPKTPTSPQRRPGRGDDSPTPAEAESSANTNAQIPATEQSGNKVATNRQQTDNKPVTKPATNRQQTDNTPHALASVKTETGNKVTAQPATHSATKWQQTENKPTTTTTFSGLVGLQRAVLMVLYDACKAARGRVSEPLTLEHLAACLKTSSGSVKTTLQRLETKQCVLRVNFKNGRGGWSRYELPEAIFRELLQLETENKLATNWQQTENKVGTQPATEPATSLSSSSSSIVLEDLKTTTTGEPELSADAQVQLAPEWQTVDVRPLADVGFTQTHLTQVIRQAKLTPTEVRDSIHFFAFDLKRNGKGREIKGPAINFFMGILRKGQPYAPPENYESPEETARREYLEGKRRLEERRQVEERELEALEFAEWRRGLTFEQEIAIVPEVVRHVPRAKEESLKAHFRENLWPSRRAAIPGAREHERAEIARQVEQSLGEARG